MQFTIKKNIVENTIIEKILFNNNIAPCQIEIPNVIRSLETLDYQCLRSKFKSFFGLYSKFIKIFGENHGGMSCVDLFSFWYTMDTLKPKIIFENGVFNGGSTWFIRNTLPEVKLFCFDPMLPNFIDKSTNVVTNQPLTIYFVDVDFIDFKDFDPNKYALTDQDMKESLAFFDCHTNALERLKQSHSKGIKKVLYNDNYPEGCGGHLTLQHTLSTTDNRFSTQKLRNEYKKFIMTHTTQIIMFPNITGMQVETGEGMFNTSYLFKNLNELETKVYGSGHEGQPEFLEYFEKHFLRYRWNTFVELI